MHRVIIPIDFSETSLNAARYAAQMLAGRKNAVAVLYNNYESEGDHDVTVMYQENLRREFLARGVESVEYESEMGGDLIQNISRLAHTVRATLIVMGITGKSVVRQAMFGSNTLKLVDQNLYPVMIIPPDATYQGIKNVALASDFKDVEETTPEALLNAVLGIFSPKLHIVNVNKDHYVSVTREIEEGKEKYRKMFPDFEIEFYFLSLNDFYQAIDQFVSDYHIDVLLTIPKHQSNAISLFKASHTKRLAYHSRIPILAAHE